MKHVFCISIIIFSYMQIAGELLTVHVNDTWEYRYDKHSYSYTNTGEVFQITTTGTFVLKIDSIITNSDTDTLFVYVTKSDSIWNCNGKDTSTKKISQQLFYKISGDTMIEKTSGGQQALYFSYWQLPDTSWSSSGQLFERKTIIKDTFVNEASLKIRNQMSYFYKSHELSNYLSTTSNADTVIWLENVGLLKQVSSSSETTDNDHISLLINSKSIECITLMKRNGKEIDLFRTSTVSTPFKGIYTNNGITKKARYYSINGCIQNKLSSSQMGSRLIVKVNPANQSCVEKILQLFK